MKKILLIELPASIEQALTEQLGQFSGLEVSCLNSVSSVGHAAYMPDIVIAGHARVVEFAGCPVLSLPPVQPLRLGNLLRQIGQMLAEPVLYTGDIIVGSYIFKPQEKSLVRRDGGAVSLTDREVDLLAYLVRHKEKPVNRDELLRNVWQYQHGVDTHTLETHIYRLRQKIEASAEEPRILLTVNGGYSLHLGGMAV